METRLASGVILDGRVERVVQIMLAVQLAVERIEVQRVKLVLRDQGRGRVRRVEGMIRVGEWLMGEMVRMKSFVHVGGLEPCG